MADDIDIEEHDVLDNPRLKNIFPGIVDIKTEVIDYEETENEYEQELFNYEIPICQEIKLERNNDENQYINNIQRNVIILGTKPSTPQPDPGAKSSTPQPCPGTSSRETFAEVTHASDNDDPKTLPCSVPLEDWGEHLANNPCFCSECQTLFPTRNAFDFHSMTLHSFLVAVSNNKAIKSTAKSSLDKYINAGDYEIDLLCTHCNKYFPNQNALIKHKYSLIPNTKYVQSNVCDPVFDEDGSLSSHQMIQDEYLSCTICSCYFKSLNSYKRHVHANHNTYIKNTVRISYNTACVFCNRNIMHPKNYNTHIQHSHTNYYLKKQNVAKPNRFQCNLCDLTFPSAHSERVHRANKHSGAKQARSTVSKALVKSEKNIEHKQLIPKSVLFKCNKCQIHFISCTTAVEHSSSCSLRKGDWKCHTCRRTFKLADRHVHTMQHELNERFRVYVVKEDIQPKVINRCVLCDVCFDDRTLSTYHTSGCRPTQSVECGICHLLIHEYAVSKHLKYHRDYNLTINDFIITDYCEVNRSVKCADVVNMDASSASSSLSLTPSKKTRDKITLYYCSNCKSYIKSNRAIQDGHMSGACLARINNWNTELCKLCGLLFTKKAIQSHKAYHKAGQIKLSNFVFVDMLSGRKIEPPFPIFKACSKCRVSFYSATALKNHVCDVEEHRSCKYCKEKFSDLALKLHVPFHEYSNSTVLSLKMEKETTPKRPILDLMMKYKSLVTIWNILYMCQTCDVVVDTYSGAVEHCQNHFCNMESYNVNISYCHKCDLKLIDACHIRHEKLHMENDINIDTFDIIIYDYSTLLTDDWMKIFNRLSHDKIQQILSKSIYNDVRGVRLRLVSDGLVSSTIYKCSLCNCYVETQSVVDHVNNYRDCANFTYKLHCPTCDINFISKSHKNEHDKLHLANDEPFRVIAFNDDNDKFINEALIAHTKPEDLKFIRCNQCGKLINKALYKAHIYKHNYVSKSKLENMVPDGIRKVNRIPPKIRPKLNSEAAFKKLLHLYKCRDCEVCVTKNSIFKHICSNQNQKKQCAKCHLHFRFSHFNKHIQIHRQYPKMTRNNINVIYIKNNTIDRGLTNAKHKIVPKQRHILNTQHNTANKTKMVFYECSQCNNFVNHERNVKRHTCGKRANTKCPQCGILIHGTHYFAHKQLHKHHKFNKKNIVIFKFKGDKIYKPIETGQESEFGESMSQYNDDMSTNETNAFKSCEVVKYSNETHSETPSKKIYARIHRCSHCNLNFVSRDRLLNHTVNNKCESEEFVECAYCNMNFSRSSIKSHQITQKCPDKMISLFIITTLVINEHNSIWSEGNWIFYCQLCDVYTLNFYPMKYHFVCDHKAFREPINCTKCNVKFARNCYKTHVELHHNELNLTFSKLNIEVLVGNVTETDRNVTHVENENHFGIDTFVTNGANNMNSCNIYRCPPCNLHFKSRSYTRLHQRRGHYHGKTTQCPKCNLKVIVKTFKQHLEMHKIYKAFTVVNCHPKRKTDTHFRADSYLYLDLSGNENVSKPPIRSVEETLARTEPSTSNRVQPTTETVQPNVNPFQPNAEPVSSTTHSSNVKLYKCNVCDVYYLTSESCNDHVYNHVALDPTEYIACKICELQFLCESLGRHMKGHREKTFNVDELVVDEYHIGGNGVTIDTYFAADRMKSKLVSTTTHSDND